MYQLADVGLGGQDSWSDREIGASSELRDGDIGGDQCLRKVRFAISLPPTGEVWPICRTAPVPTWQLHRPITTRDDMYRPRQLRSSTEHTVEAADIRRSLTTPHPHAYRLSQALGVAERGLPHAPVTTVHVGCLQHATVTRRTVLS